MIEYVPIITVTVGECDQKCDCLVLCLSLIHI